MPERELLRSPRRPIVLLRRRADAPVAESVAPGSPWLGVMLPYTPLHHLLLADSGGALVMTSGNRSDEPIAVDDDEARASGSAGSPTRSSAHDRPIHRRCEDSVVRAAFPVRRSRGYAPGRAAAPGAPPAARSLAVGAELKSTFCVARGGEAFLSPHLGDLDTELAYARVPRRHRAVPRDARRASRDDRPRPPPRVPLDEVGARAGRASARRRAAPPRPRRRVPGRARRDRPGARARLRRHRATAPTGRSGAASCCAATSPASSASRSSSPCRCRAARRRSASPGASPPRTSSAPGGPCRSPRWPGVRESLRVNAPLSSGMGRLFDAVAALLGLRETVTYEGQAAIELELLAGETDGSAVPVALRRRRRRSSRRCTTTSPPAGPRPRSPPRSTRRSRPARPPHARRRQGRDTVVLSGGTFQNLRLRAATRARLEAHGFRVLTHRLVPPNDGGISYGQAAVAASSR